MRYCLSCKYLSPSEALYCARCACSFGGRRCPQQHLSPTDAVVCIRCGSPELTEAAPFLAPLRLLGAALALPIGIALVYIASQGVRQFSARKPTIPVFTIWTLDRLLAGLLIAGLVLGLLPRKLRRILFRSLGELALACLYFLAGLPRLVRLLLYSSRRGR